LPINIEGIAWGRVGVRVEGGDDLDGEELRMGGQVVTYESIADRLQPGDIIAFSGQGLPSAVVKFVTRSVVSHVAIVLDTTPQVLIIELTPIEGFSGVTITALADRLAKHPGEMWWLPLAGSVRRGLDVPAMQAFLQQQNHKAYDALEAINSGLNIPALTRGGYPMDDNYVEFFCSELVLAGLKAGGVLQGLKAASVTPNELCCYAIYGPDYYQIKRDRLCEIHCVNSVAVGV
jgi:hypothetical protein